MKKEPYRIDYSAEAEDHLALLTARQSTTILDTVPKQLAHEPAVETRNRGRLRPNLLAHYRLRVGDLRVYYDVEESPEKVVIVKAVGVKSRDRVLIGGKEIEL